jgi:hypothetical protein
VCHNISFKSIVSKMACALRISQALKLLRNAIICSEGKYVFRSEIVGGWGQGRQIRD